MVPHQSLRACKVKLVLLEKKNHTGQLLSNYKFNFTRAQRSVSNHLEKEQKTPHTWPELTGWRWAGYPGSGEVWHRLGGAVSCYPASASAPGGWHGPVDSESLERRQGWGTHGNVTRVCRYRVLRFCLCPTNCPSNCFLEYIIKFEVTQPTFLMIQYSCTFK